MKSLPLLTLAAAISCGFIMYHVVNGGSQVFTMIKTSSLADFDSVFHKIGAQSLLADSLGEDIYTEAYDFGSERIYFVKVKFPDDEDLQNWLASTPAITSGEVNEYHQVAIARRFRSNLNVFPGWFPPEAIESGRTFFGESISGNYIGWMAASRGRSQTDGAHLFFLMVREHREDKGGRQTKGADKGVASLFCLRMFHGPVYPCRHPGRSGITCGCEHHAVLTVSKKLATPLPASRNQLR